MNWLEKRWYSNKPAPCTLAPLEALYRYLSGKKTKRDLKTQWHAPVPLIVVGNITTGGTGKTPLTTYLVELLKRNGFTPGIVSRGYKSKASYYPFDVSKASSPREAGDEPYMLHARCQCPVIIDADRVSAVQYLLEHYDCDVVISDDGLQHYRLGRDIEIAVIDSKRGLGNQRQIPMGPLREPIGRLQHVDFIVTNGGQWSELPSELVSYPMVLNPTVLKDCVNGFEQSIEGFKPRKINAVAGIGNPQRFFDTLTSLFDAEIKCHPKPDHYQFIQSDFEFRSGEVTVMTEKDAVKAAPLNLTGAWYLEVSAELPTNFESAIMIQVERIAKEKGNRNNG